MTVKFTAVLLASAALAACSDGGAPGAGDTAAAPCDMNVPAEDRTTGRVLSETQRSRLESGEANRVLREKGRLAKACAERAGFTDIGNVQTVRPGPTVLAADGSRGPTTDNQWSTVGTRDGVRMRIVVDAAGVLTSAPLEQP